MKPHTLFKCSPFRVSWLRWDDLRMIRAKGRQSCACPVTDQDSESSNRQRRASGHRGSRGGGRSAAALAVRRASVRCSLSLSIFFILQTFSHVEIQ